LTPKQVSSYHGLWIGPGSPFKDLSLTLSAIRIARESGIPLLGTCAGFQHVVLEIARNILGFRDAQSAEYDPYASSLFISELTCSLMGLEMDIDLVEGSQVADIYGQLSCREHYYCNFGLNPEFADLIKAGPAKAVGSDAEGEIRILEIPDHPFFISTLFVPQLRSVPGQPHPLVTAFLKAVLDA
jgi:CTP synthase (UTP-ammonia lyase)